MTTFNDLKPSTHLKSADIEEPTVVTIERWKREEVGKEKEVKAVIYFEELEKGLVLNATNANTISKLCNSSHLEEWAGHKIMLYVKDDVEYGGEMVRGIRVRPARTKPTSQRAVPRQDPISTGPASDFPGDRPMPKRRAAVDQDLDDDITF